MVFVTQHHNQHQQNDASILGTQLSSFEHSSPPAELSLLKSAHISAGHGRQAPIRSTDLNRAIYTASNTKKLDLPRNQVMLIGQDQIHANQVAEILEQNGVKSKDIGLVRLDQRYTRYCPDNPQQYMENLIKSKTKVMNDFTTGLKVVEEESTKTNSRIGFVNISSGIDPVYDFYRPMMEDLKERDKQGNYVRPKLRQIIYGDTPLTDKAEKLKKIRDFAKPYIDNSPTIKQAQLAYDTQIKRLYDLGITTVVSASNSHSPENITAGITQEGGELNWFDNKHTISVGAFDQNGDTSGFSSRGNSTHGPNVSAWGENVVIPRELDTIDGEPDGLIHGTSFSAPAVTALLSQVNKLEDLTPEQERVFIHRIAIDTDAPFNAEGYGVIPPYLGLELVS